MAARIQNKQFKNKKKNNYIGLKVSNRITFTNFEKSP